MSCLGKHMVKALGECCNRVRQNLQIPGSPVRRQRCTPDNPEAERSDGVREHPTVRLPFATQQTPFKSSPASLDAALVALDKLQCGSRVRHTQH